MTHSIYRVVAAEVISANTIQAFRELAQRWEPVKA